MANKNEPRGLTPWGRIISMHTYAASIATAIYPKDLVMMNSAGKITAATAGSTQLMGVAMSYKAATAATVLIMDDPDQQYTIMDDAGGATVITQTYVGNNGDVVATAGNATTLKSRHVLKRNTTNLGVADGNLRLLGIVGATGANSTIRVVINEHHWAKKVTGF